MVAVGEAGNDYKYLEDGLLQEWLGGRNGGREAGNDCTSTWRRDICRNGWEFEMVAVGESGNDYKYLEDGLLQE